MNLPMTVRTTTRELSFTSGDTFYIRSVYIYVCFSFLKSLSFKIPQFQWENT